MVLNYFKTTNLNFIKFVVVATAKLNTLHKWFIVSYRYVQ